MEHTHVLLYFSAKWCQPCKVMSKSVEEIRDAHPEFLVSKIDIEEQADFAGAYKIRSLPTVLLIDSEGTEIVRVVGARSSKDLEDSLEAKISS